MLKECVDFRARWHRWRCARARDGDAGDGASEARCRNDIFALGERNGEATAKCVTSAGGFDDWPSVHGGNVLRDLLVFDERTFGPKRKDNIAHASIDQCFGGPFALREVCDRQTRERGGFRFVWREIVAEREDTFGQNDRGRRIEDGWDAEFAGDAQTMFDRRESELELRKKNGRFDNTGARSISAGVIS